MESGLEEGTLKLVTTIDSGRLNFTRGGVDGRLVLCILRHNANSFCRTSVERPLDIESLVESWPRRWGGVFYSPGLRDSSLFYGATGIEPFRSKYVSQIFF